jgi:hypothetical protein
MKYYNIELLQAAAEKLQQFLYELQIDFEISAAGPYYHFEILTNAAGADIINEFLDNNTI